MSVVIACGYRVRGSHSFWTYQYSTFDYGGNFGSTAITTNDNGVGGRVRTRFEEACKKNVKSPTLTLFTMNEKIRIKTIKVRKY